MKRLILVTTLAIALCTATGKGRDSSSKVARHPKRLRQIPEEEYIRPNETINVHVVPHSYNLDFLTMVDTYFPSM
jgi:hypothetical protein